MTKVRYRRCRRCNGAYRLGRHPHREERDFKFRNPEERVIRALTNYGTIPRIGINHE